MSMIKGTTRTTNGKNKTILLTLNSLQYFGGNHPSPGSFVSF